MSRRRYAHKEAHMTPGTVFISHRAEYAKLVRELQRAIEKTSRGKIEVFISEDIPRGATWRAAIEAQLQNSENLFLVYGAPYEDWSWCFYEAGYFAALAAQEKTSRRIYCIARPEVPAPGPLSDLQMVTDSDQLVEALGGIYGRNAADYSAAELRSGIRQMTKALFGTLAEYMTYPRVYFIANDTNFGSGSGIPADAELRGEEVAMNDLFGIAKSSVKWGEIVARGPDSDLSQEQVFRSKWIEETTKIILAARENRFIAPQTVLIGRAGRRFRFLLYGARIQGDGIYCCEFLAIDEVGGPPALGLSRQLLSLLTSIRMGFRFRYELIEHFPNDFDELSEEDRQARIQEIPWIISNLTTESDARGNVSLEDLLSAFDELETARIRRLCGQWPILQKEMYRALGVSPDGKVVTDQGLRGSNVERFRIAFDALRLMNIEFLSRCCGRVSRMMSKSEEDLANNARLLDEKIKALTKLDMRSATYASIPNQAGRMVVEGPQEPLAAAMTATAAPPAAASPSW
jgi:hypothetical protein